MTPSIVALVPARAGSRRVPGKNVRELGGLPLMAWTIIAAREAGIFDRVLLCTDSEEYGEIGKEFGALYYHRHPSADDECDIEWLRQVLATVRFDAFAILRPTSPFRTAHTIRRAWRHFLDHQPCDSLRAVEPVRQHPGKMWLVCNQRVVPVLPGQTVDGTPYHSSPTQALPIVYVQNASLEIAWTKTVTEQGTIAGANVLPFFEPALNIDTEADWQEAERILRAREPLAVGAGEYGECD